MNKAETVMSKVLVVVYSLTGTSRNVAQLLCSQQGWEMAEIREASPRTAAGALGIARCIFESLLRLRPAIRYSGPPPAGFDAVVLISPIWALQLAGPMRSFVATHHDKLPVRAVITVMGGSGAPNAVAEIARIAHRASRANPEHAVHRARSHGRQLCVAPAGLWHLGGQRHRLAGSRSPHHAVAAVGLMAHGRKVTAS